MESRQDVAWKGQQNQSTWARCTKGTEEGRKRGPGGGSELVYSQSSADYGQACVGITERAGNLERVDKARHHRRHQFDC